MRIAVYESNGGVAIFRFSPSARFHGEKQEDFERRVADNVVPLDKSYHLMDRDGLPARRWRYAFKLVDGQVVIDLNMARAVRAGELEAIRQQKSLALREARLLAEEDGDSNRAGRIMDQLRRLRSVNLHDAVRDLDLETLDNFEPAEFKE